jgi:hypothetical protein
MKYQLRKPRECFLRNNEGRTVACVGFILRNSAQLAKIQHGDMLQKIRDNVLLGTQPQIENWRI